MESVETFEWGSKLGVSVALFLLYGGLYVLVSVAGTLLTFDVIPDGDRIFLMSDRADVVFYGKPPREMMAEVPAMRTVRNQGVVTTAAFMCAAGLLFVAVAWFGLRDGHAWALWTLVAAGVVVVPFWGLLFAPYVRIGAPIWFGHPPFMSVPVIILIPATVLGYLALR